MNMNSIANKAQRMYSYGLRMKPLHAVSKNAQSILIASTAAKRCIRIRTQGTLTAGEMSEMRHRSTSLRLHSTAPVTADTSENLHARKLKRKKDPIIVTERAANRIKEILASPNGNGAIGIKLGVKRRGCNGLSYTLNYAFENDIKPSEEQFITHGVTVIIEPMALFNVVGTVMDWEETDMSSEFTFENPNSKGECGCGESFNV